MNKEEGNRWNHSVRDTRCRGGNESDRKNGRNFLAGQIESRMCSPITFWSVGTMLNFTNILSFFFLCPQTAISTSCRYRKLYFRLKDDRGDRVSFAEDRRESLPGLSVFRRPGSFIPPISSPFEFLMEKNWIYSARVSTLFNPHRQWSCRLFHLAFSDSLV